MCTRDHQHIVLRGTAPDGILWTRHAEPYPAGLSEYLASVICAQAGFASSNEYDVRLQELVQTVKVPGILVHGEKDPDVGVRESDRISTIFSDANWQYTEDWLYFKIPNATHEWQTQYNQEMWDWLADRPNINHLP